MTTTNVHNKWLCALRVKTCQSLAEYSSFQFALLPCSGSACFVTMQQCLDSYFSEELVDSYVCSWCRSKTGVSRKFRCISTAPEISMITLRWPVNALQKQPAANCGYKNIYLNVENPHMNGKVLLLPITHCADWFFIMDSKLAVGITHMQGLELSVL